MSASNYVVVTEYWIMARDKEGSVRYRGPYYSKQAMSGARATLESKGYMTILKQKRQVKKASY